MRAGDPQNPYEIYCHRCNVSAPVGTRRCIHCGERLSGEQRPQRAELLGLFEADSGEADEEREEFATSIGSAAPKVALWILLLLGGFLYRFCN